MAWTYDFTDLSGSTEDSKKNIVRYLVGDTNILEQQVQDEEILFALVEEGSRVFSAAALVAKTIASSYARKVNIELDGQIKAEYGKLYDNYTALAQELSDKAKSSGGRLGVSGGGLDEQNAFKRYQFEGAVGCYKDWF